MQEINWRAIFKGFAWLFSLAGIVALMSFIGVKKDAVKCTKVQILIPGADNFIEREEIDAILKQGEGELVGRNLENINIHKIENTIKANPYIAFVKVYNDMDGVIYVKIRQRQPILRVLNAGGQDYYIDSYGLKMPMSANFTANVLVATGNILEGFGGRVDTLLTATAKSLYNIARYAKKDTLWDAQFEQLYVNDKNDIEMIPRVGSQRIILGNDDSLAVKMTNLLAFYKQAMPRVGWNVYKTINLKYTNQIVCEKYDSLELVRKAKNIVMDTAMVQQHAVVNEMVKTTIQEEINKATVATLPNPSPVAKPKEEIKKIEKPEVKKVVAKTVEKKAEVKKEVKAPTVKKPAVKVETSAKPVKKEEPKTAKTTTAVKPAKTFAEKMAEKQKTSTPKKEEVKPKAKVATSATKDKK